MNRQVVTKHVPALAGDLRLRVLLQHEPRACRTGYSLLLESPKVVMLCVPHSLTGDTRLAVELAVVGSPSGLACGIFNIEHRNPAEY